MDTTPKYIKGFANKYSITHDGRVFSNFVLHCNGATKPEKRELNPYLKGGKPTVQLTHKDHTRTLKIHRLVKEYFPTNPRECNTCKKTKSPTEYRTLGQNTCLGCHWTTDSNKSTKELKSSYVRRTLTKRTNLKEVPQQLIELQRAKIQLIRAVKSKTN